MLHKKTRFNQGLKLFFILLPLLLSAAWLIVAIKNKLTFIATDHGLKLSPSQNTTPIIIGLVLFQAGYIIFMILMFGDDIRDFFTGHSISDSK